METDMKTPYRSYLDRNSQVSMNRKSESADPY